MIKNHPYLENGYLENNMMGPDPAELLERSLEGIEFRPGMRVLDLGCGRGVTSVALAKKYGVTVFATDLWETANDNFRRFEELGLQDLIIPVHADANDLPYADGFFDAAVAIDSYNYFGTNDTFFQTKFVKTVKKGGILAAEMPGWKNDINEPPASLHGIMENEDMVFSVFRSSDWWRSAWERDGLAEILHCGAMPNGMELWNEWAKIAREKYGFKDDEFLAADKNGDLAMITITARRK